MKTAFYHFLLVTLFTASCSSKSKDDDGSLEETEILCQDSEDNDGDGHTDCADQDCGDGICGECKFEECFGQCCAEGEVCQFIGFCGKTSEWEEFPIVASPVSLMILLDRSASMVTNTTDEGKTRWQAAVDAFDNLLSSWSRDDVKLGLDYFPDGSQGSDSGFVADCGVTNQVQKDCTTGNESHILQLIQNADPPLMANMSPMYCAMDNFNNASYAPGCAASELERHRYLLLVTDDSDNCGLDCRCEDQGECDNGDTWASSVQLGDLAKELLDSGVHTIVISLGGTVDGPKLDAIARNGGTSFTSYIAAENGAKLEEAFDAVVGSLGSCVWNLNHPDESADPSRINILFDDRLIPNIGEKNCDTASGWRWLNEDKTKVQFCGSACARVRREIVDVTAIWGYETVYLV